MALPSFDLTGKVCFITGTTSGLGRQFALCLSEAGAKVVITGRRKERLDALAKEINDAGGFAYPIAFDVTDLPAGAAAIAETEEKVGPIWCLVNNSGITVMRASQKISQPEYDQVMDTNLRAPFFLSQEVAKRMIDRGAPGRIINIASMHSYVELKGGITYCMSKAAVQMMTQVMALEWARYGIRVNAMNPGYIRTDINSEYYDSEAGQKEIKGWPMRRIGKDTDLNGLLLLLASEAGDFMTGAGVRIDDGQALGF